MSDPNRAIAGRIRLELAELARVAERACRIWAEVRPSPDDFLVDAVALNLHSFYAGLEHIFELVADRVDHALPSGPSWHQELLRQMAAELPGVRPAAVTVDLMDRLDRYRGFRHVVRNVYTYNLDVRQIATLMDDLPAVEAQLRDELTGFAQMLEQISQD